MELKNGCKIVDHKDSEDGKSVTYITKCGWKKEFKETNQKIISKIKKHKCIEHIK